LRDALRSRLPWERVMARYYFDLLDDDGIFIDEEGLELSSLRAVRAEAAKSLADMARDAVFAYLLKHNFYRAGLEFKYDSCGLWSRLSLRQVDDRRICEYCGHSNMTSLHVRNRGDWRFRKSGLLAKGRRDPRAADAARARARCRWRSPAAPNLG